MILLTSKSRVVKHAYDIIKQGNAKNLLRAVT